MEGKKLNNIWKELNSLVKGFFDIDERNAKRHAKQLEHDAKLAERIIKAIQDKPLDVTVENKIDTLDVVSATNEVKQSVDALSEATVKVEITNHQKQQDITFPDNQKVSGYVNLYKKDKEELAKLIGEAIDIPANEVDVQVKQFSSDPSEYTPIRLTDGERFIDVEELFKKLARSVASVGGGGTNNNTLDSILTELQTLNTLVAGGGGLGSGDTDATVDNIEIQSGDDLLLQDGSFLLIQ